MDAMCYFLLFWYSSADVVLHYLEPSLHGLLRLNPYPRCSSLNMKIVSKQKNIYIFRNISMHLTMFWINLMKWNPRLLIVAYVVSFSISIFFSHETHM